ncbi:MAG: flagellar motor switch protein FliN [Nitrospinaceae bacterium]
MAEEEEEKTTNEDVEALEDLEEDTEDLEGEEEGEEEGKKEADQLDHKSLDLILDIPLTVTVELGRSKMLINDLLQLGQGSVVELTKLVGEPLEVLVNQKLVARGEVVVVNEKFGVRLTDIVTPMERVQSLS